MFFVGSKSGGDQTEGVLRADMWPMVGRDREFNLIVSAIRKTGGAAGAAVTGAMGVGKSRLVREALAACGPASVSWVAGSSAAQTIPLGAFVRWLPDDAHEPLRGTNQVIAALIDEAGSRPCVVVVDDAHLLDDASAFMLDQLVVRQLARVVLTVGSDSPVSDSVAALWRHGGLQRVDVHPLGHPECVTLLQSVLGGPVDPVSERRMWRLTRGNVRFLRHIVEEEVERGRLRCQDGTWTWSPGAVVAAPVCELIEHQMGDLSEALAETVDVLSVAEPLATHILLDIVGAGPIEEAERRALITVEGGDESQVRLAHPLYAEVRRMKAGHIRLRRLRGIVASRLEQSSDPARILRRGALLLESDAVVTAEEMLRASDAAVWRGDSALALRFAEAARSVDGGWRTSIACAEALTMAGQFDEAQEALAVGDAPVDACVPLSVGRAKSLFLHGRTEDALAVLRCDHTQRSESHGAAQDAIRAFLIACDGELDVAMGAADAALEHEALPDVSVMLASTAKVLAMGELGRVDELRATAKRARNLGGRSTATSFLRFILDEAQCAALQLAGHCQAAAAAVDDIRSDDLPPDIYRWVSMISGSVSLASGRVDAAVPVLRDALSSQCQDFLGGWLSRYCIDLAVALAVRGESEAAKRCLDHLASHRHPGMAFLEPMEMLATAWVSASTGAVTQAIAQARAAAVSAATRGLAAREVLCLQTATRFGDTTAVGRLAELVDLVGGRRAPAAARHAVALADSDGEGLSAASETYAAMGDLLSALDAAAQASAAFRRADRRGSALSAAGRVRELLETCGEVRTPAVADATAPPVFTGREREVIMLAGGGLTNREIADRLQLSVRTVEGHMYRAAGRVGARDRNELARVIGEAFAVSA